MATRPRPPWPCITPKVQYQKICENSRSLTERNRAGNFAGESLTTDPRRARVLHQRRSRERAHAQSLHFKHLVRLLLNLPRLDRFFQFGFPLQPCLGRLGVQGVQASQSTIVVNRTRKYRSSVVDGIGTGTRTWRSDARVWTLRILFTTE